MSKDGHATIDVRSILRNGRIALFQVLTYDHKVSLLVNNAKDDDLWQMLEMVRDTKYLDDFLQAVMELSMESWWEQKLNIHAAFTCFHSAEVATLIRIYQLNTGHHSPVMEHLDYDAYWTRKVETETKDADVQRACQMLKWATAGLPNGRPVPGFQASASKKCLAKLTKLVDQAERSAKRKRNNDSDNSD